MIKQNQRISIFEKLKSLGFPSGEYFLISDAIKLKKGKLKIVGGNVRDYLLKKKITSDPDLATNLNPEEVILCLQKKKIKYFDSSIKYGTVVAIINDIKFEITTLRKDISSDGRWPIVSFTECWEEDAKRRDFTINAIYLSEEGLFDPLNGIDDLKKNKVVFIGEPKDRIIEDNLRILRFLRFSLLYAENFDTKGIKAVKLFSDKLRTVSFERRFSELKKFICLKSFEKKFKTILDTKVLQNCFQIEVSKSIENFFKIERKLNNISYLRRIKFFLRGSNNLNFTLKNSSFKKDEILRISTFLDIDYSLDYEELFYKKNSTFVLDQCIFDCIDGKIEEFLLVKIYKILKNWEKPIFPISGRDVKSLGITDGFIIGYVLDQIETWWIEKKFKPSKQECIDRLRSLLP